MNKFESIASSTFHLGLVVSPNKMKVCVAMCSNVSIFNAQYTLFLDNKIRFLQATRGDMGVNNKA